MSWLFCFSLEECVERVGVGTEFTEMCGGRAFSLFVLTAALLATDDAESLQVPHDSRLGISQRLRIDGKRHQHFL